MTITGSDKFFSIMNRCLFIIDITPKVEFGCNITFVKVTKIQSYNSLPVIVHILSSTIYVLKHTISVIALYVSSI